MTEKLLQAIWGFQYFNRAELTTTKGEKVEIIHPGTINTNQGPDFLNARIKIGGTLLIGSVEIHIKASEWNRHQHSSDNNYNNVILHVVEEDDAPGINSLPVLELKQRISKLLIDQYSGLLQQTSFIPCASNITQVNELTLQAWNERLVAERMTRKAKGILTILEKTGNHWEETFWRLLARSFGTKVNADAFENIAQQIPIKLLAKHKQSLLQIEALLLGSANLIPQQGKDDYTNLLQREYHFLQQKYNLQPSLIPVHFLRMRPQNFPTVRLAQLAALVHSSEHLFSKVLDAHHVHDVKKLLQITASSYWNNNFRLGGPSAVQPKKLGTDMVQNIIINTIVPMLFAYGLYRKKEEIKDKAVEWLQQTGPETNTITKGFLNISISNRSALESQALIELKNEYCNHRRCLNCAVGNALLKKWNA